MTALLEFREMVKKIYSKNAVFILPLIKFLLAFVVINTVNGQLGYMSKIDNMALVLIVSLMCSFLPLGSITLFGALFSLLHMYSLSLEVALVGFCLYLVLFVLFLRLNPNGSIAVVITPILFIMKMPYVIPVVMGLIGTPMSAVPVACGVIAYYFLMTVVGNAPTISTMGEEASAKIRLMIDGIIGNKTMLVVVISFAITLTVVYLIRRMSVDYSWTIAMVAGALANLVILLVGDLLYDTGLSVLEAIVGSLVAILAGKIIEFFRFCVDYSRTEKVQFEDDEYYYYVKAIPKMNVAEATNTVKRINTQRGGGYPEGRASVSGRSVTTERTARSADYYRNGRQSAYGNRPDRINGGRSVTINSNGMSEDEDTDDYEEIF